jgi:hypothetical protein
MSFRSEPVLVDQQLIFDRSLPRYLEIARNPLRLTRSARMEERPGLNLYGPPIASGGSGGSQA